MQSRNNAINPSQEEIGEMNVDTLGFDASVGHSIGGTVTMTTKAGTNALHGSLRDTFTNKRWAAMGHFQGDNYKYQLVKSGCRSDSSDPACEGIKNKYGWPGVHEHNIGMAIGGPVYIPKIIDGRNKLFFFQSIAIDDFNGTGTSSLRIPTPAERTGNFTDLIDPAHPTPPAEFTQACPGATYYGRYQIYNPFSVQMVNGVPRRQPICGNIIPSNLMANNKMVSLYNSLLPNPTTNDPTVNNYVYTTTAPQTYHDFSTRVDYVPNPNNVIFVRYTHTRYTKMGQGWTVGNIDEQSGPRWIDVPAAGWNRVINATTNIDVNFGGSSFRTHCCYYLGYQKYKPSSIGLPTYLDDYAATGVAPTLPIMSISSYASVGQTDNSQQDHTTWAFRGNVSHLRGKHSIKAGWEYRLQFNSQGPQGNTSGTYSFGNTYTQQNNGTDARFTQDTLGLSYAAFLMGVPDTSSVSYTDSWSLSSPYVGFYISDTWHVTPKLTIIPGIRYEYEYGVTESKDRQLVGWDANASLPIAAPVNAAYQTLYNNLPANQKALMPASLTIAGGPIYAGVNGATRKESPNSGRILPRIAVAYSLTRNTVLRAGWGLFFDTLNASVPWLVQPGYSVTTSVPSSTSFGTNFDINNRPLTDPFPSVNGTQFNTPIGNTLGTLYYLGGGGPGNVYDDVVPARQNRVTVSIQRQIGQSTMVEATVAGAWTKKIAVSRTLTSMPASLYQNSMQPNAMTANLLSTQVANPFNIANFASIQTSNPGLYALMAKNSYFMAATQSLGSISRPYAWMGSVGLTRPIGETTFHQLQLNFTRKLSKGLTSITSFQLVGQHDRDYFVNSWDTTPSWEGSNASRPYRFTSQTVWELPFGRGRQFAKTGILSALVGGFQLSFTYELSPGPMISFGNLFYIGDPNDIKLDKATYANNLAAGGSDYVQWLTAGNLVATPIIDSNGVVTSCTYTGTGLVTNPQCQPNYNYTMFPRRLNNVRQMALSNMNANVERSFRITEKAAFDVRFETYNTLNHQVLAGPNTSPTDPNFGRITGDPGAQGGFSNPRWFSFMGRLRF
jgi:hypothetical protein